MKYTKMIGFGSGGRVMGPFVKFVKKTVCLTILAAMLFGLAAGSTSARFGRTVKAAEDGAIMIYFFKP